MRKEKNTMEEKNIVYMFVCYSGKRGNIEAKSFLDACDKLKKNTELDPKEPEYIDPKDIFQVIDIPG